MRSRSFRRHHAKRITKRWRNIYLIDGWFKNFSTGQVDLKKLKLASKQQVSCSCSMCGNPRKFQSGWHKLTFQERRLSQARRYNQGKC